MLREISKAVLAYFCRESGWAHYGMVSVTCEEDPPPSKPAAVVPAVCEPPQSVNSSLLAPGITLNKDTLYVLLGKAKEVFLDSLCTQNNLKYHKKKNNHNNIPPKQNQNQNTKPNRIWRRNQDENYHRQCTHAY